MSKALATHAKSFSTKSATSPNRPRWLYIAHTRNLAVGENSAEKSAETVRPPTRLRYDRTSSNGYKNSRWAPDRNDRQPTRGTTAEAGRSAQRARFIRFSRRAPSKTASVLFLLNRHLEIGSTEVRSIRTKIRLNRIAVHPPITRRFIRLSWENSSLHPKQDSIAKHI